MREIKFRAWDYTSNVMRNDITEMVFNSDGTLNQINVETGSDILFPEKECVLMQYTGLKDRNGVEIYEGDIVKDLTTKTYLGSKKITSRIGQVKYGDYYAASDDPYCYADVTGFHIDGGVFSSNLKDYFDKELEVIGNPYENPELLEQQ